MSIVMDDEFEDWQPEDTANEEWDYGAEWQPEKAQDLREQLTEADTRDRMMAIAREHLEAVLDRDPDALLDESDLDHLLWMVVHIAQVDTKEQLRVVLEGVISWKLDDLMRYARDVRTNVAYADNDVGEAYERYRAQQDKDPE